MDQDQNNSDQLSQGQEIYSGDAPPTEEVTAEQELGESSYPPDLPPPPIPMGGAFETAKHFLVPGILILVAIVIVIFIIRLFTSGGAATSKEASLTYWILWEEEKTYEPVIKAFQKTHPKATIKVIKQTPKEYRERLENSILKGEGPDIFRFHNTWLPMLLKKEVIAPIPNTLIDAKSFESTYYPVVAKDLKAGNSYYGVPFTFDALGLFYNKSMLKSVGASPPKTWDEVWKVAKEIAVPDTNGKLKTAGIALGSAKNVEFWSDILGLMLLQNSASVTSPKGDNAADALLFYTKFAQPPDNIWDESFANSILSFSGEKVAMMFAPSWIAIEIKARNPNLDFAIAPVPQVSDSSVGWATYWVEGVSSKSKNVDVALEFLKFLHEKDTATLFYTESAKSRLFGEPYARTDLASQLKGDPYLDAIVTQGPFARSGYLSARTFDNGLNDRTIKYYEDAVNSVNNGTNPKEALTTVDRGVSQILTDFGIAASP